MSLFPLTFETRCDMIDMSINGESRGKPYELTPTSMSKIRRSGPLGRSAPPLVDNQDDVFLLL